MKRDAPEEKTGFGVLVVGPSGSGKSTLCAGLQEFLKGIRRKCCVVNLDPANENYKYSVGIDIQELVNLDEVMAELKLGPNGGLMYCLDFLAENYSWLSERLREHDDEFFIFDLPGQLELFLNSDSLRSVIAKLTSGKGFRRLKLTIIELFDAHYVQDGTKFLSACTYSLVSMINFELPHINVLSKVDLLTNAADLDFRIEFYTECSDFEPLAEKLESSKKYSHFGKKFSKLTKNLCQLLDNYSKDS